jgi:uncharacterized membrane protein YdjX (TVP38/TMEM64 family)
LLFSEDNVIKNKQEGYGINNRKVSTWLLGILLMVTFFFYLVLEYHPWFFEQWDSVSRFFSNHKGISKLLNSTGPYSILIFTLIQALQVIIAFIPGEATGFIGGYLYGTIPGFIFSTIGLTLGSYVAFKLARIFGMPLVKRLVREDTLNKFHTFMEGKGMIVAFLLFVIPGFPKDSLCYILGVSQMELKTFLIISTIGRAPGTLMLAMQGASIRGNHFALFFILLSITALASIIVYLYRERIEHWLKVRIKKH